MTLPSGQKQGQRGLGLVEIMVSLVIGLILVAGVFQVFQSSRATHRVSDALARVQENPRFAMLFLSRDLRMAGHYGCARHAPLHSMLNDSTHYLYAFDIHITGHRDRNGTGQWTPTLPSHLEDVLRGRGIKGTDIVTVRAGDGNAIQILPPYRANAAAALHVGKDNGLAAGDIVVISDCEKATVFQISGSNPGASGRVEHGIGGGSPGNWTEQLGKAYRGDAELMRINTTSYFLRENVVGEPALWRRIGTDPAEELVEGVDDLQLRYGLDTDGDGTADEYKTADAGIRWQDVVSVQLSLRVRSREDNIVAEPQTVDYNGRSITDRRLRQTFASTIAIRNSLR